MAPKFRICLEQPDVELAVSLGAQKIQVDKSDVTTELVAMSHEKGLICNVSSVDTEEEARKYFEMGVDTILTKQYKDVTKGAI